MSTYEIWIPDHERARVLPLLEALSDEGSLLRSPLPHFPSAARSDSGSIYLWEASGRHDPFGQPVGQDILAEPGWTEPKFAAFITSREHLHVVIDGQKCPTLTALAGYLQCPFMLHHAMTNYDQIGFITELGDSTIAAYQGEPEGIDLVRETYFGQGLKATLELDSLDVRRSGSPNPHNTQSLAGRRNMLLAHWENQHELKELTAPVGAELSPLDFRRLRRGDVDPARPVLAYADSSKHLYEIILPVREELEPLEVLCAVDGVLQRYVDPVSGTVAGFGAHPADWADWILLDSVPTEKRRDMYATPASAMDEQLFRAANNIVEYQKQEGLTTWFSTARELEAWLRRALGNHIAPIKARLLNDASFILAAENPSLLQQHDFDTSESKEVKALYLPRAFHPWEGKMSWWNQKQSSYALAPSLRSSMDGSTLASFWAENCLDFTDLEPHLLPSDARADKGSWFVLWLEGTKTCITVPAYNAYLSVGTDHDGATAEIAAHEYFTWIEERRIQRAFKQDWETWLDEDHVLTPEEIQRGLETLAELIEGGSE